MSLEGVSVVIANHNYGHFLAGALDSATAEKPGRVIVVDDGSTDDSIRIVANKMEGGAQQEYCGVPSFVGTINGVEVRLFSADESRGPAAARNWAMQVAWDETDYFAILDADDRFLAGRIKACVDLLQKYGEVAGAVYTDYHHVRNGVHFRHCKKSFVKRELVFDNMVHSACVIRKSVLAEVGLYDESMPPAEDYELWMRIAKEHIILHLPEVMMDVNEGAHQLSRRTSSDFYAKQLQTLRGRHCQSLLS
jgi:glycosyltransferase involved in cell wall biosynthesis